MKIIFTVIPALLFSFSLQAQNVANIEIPNTLTLPDSDKILVLNSAGIRTKFIFDIYTSALYLEQKQTTVPDIYQPTGNKRIHMHFLYDEISKEKLTGGWSDGFKNNHNEEELKQLQARINQFNALFTAVIINGNTKGSLKDTDFFTAC
jgi:hypothetical protein